MLSATKTAENKRLRFTGSLKNTISIIVVSIEPMASSNCTRRAKGNRLYHY
ncbi:hypothetical protein [Wolbachia endosymbiont of Litomosoides brasiliensis]|uniref:hypothetical protein n=1 Tax=Wolbachia endosymbiont of Litomosoides brasiliensis TaxID=1812117 RepID=UPI001FE93176|nr:hypothetical protein [Wolbachia endosymbiont of Litomosoides brasiliensis]